MGNIGSDYLTKRRGTWHFVRRVPTEHAALDKRGIVITSTKIKVAADPNGTKAARAAEKLNEVLEAYWRSLGATQASEARQAYTDAVKLARSLGVNYLPAAQVAEAPIAQLLDRVETLIAGEQWKDPALRKAALGGVDKPVVMLSGLFDEYELTQRLKLAKMSPDQTRKWTSAKKRAIDILIEHVKDKAIHELTRDDALEYAAWWEDRVINDGIDPGTANKNISHITGQIRAVSKRLELRLDNVFAGTRLAGGHGGSRKPFTIEFIRDVILAYGALADLNDEARDVVCIVIETGARPSEIINLTPRQIVLAGNIPHIKIAPDGRLLKTEQSERDLPLVGLALEAMRRHPNGFPRYFDRGSTLSATLMKHFRSRDLLPTEKHSIYSFRHSFKDRLRAVEAPEELIDEMMGHVIDKPKYGDGYGLELKLKYIEMIALGTAATAPA